MNRILLSLLFATLLSCGGTTVTGKDFSTACVADADCVAVFLGNVCAQCTCPTTAISRSSKAAYDTEYAAAVKGCGGTPVNICSCIEVATAVRAAPAPPRPPDCAHAADEVVRHSEDTCTGVFWNEEDAHLGSWAQRAAVAVRPTLGL